MEFIKIKVFKGNLEKCDILAALFDHELSSFLVMASLWKYSHDCDILLLQHKEMEDVRYRLKLFLPSKNTSIIYMLFASVMVCYLEGQYFTSHFYGTCTCPIQLLFAVAPMPMPMAFSKN